MMHICTPPYTRTESTMAYASSAAMFEEGVPLEKERVNESSVIAQYP